MILWNIPPGNPFTNSFRCISSNPSKDFFRKPLRDYLKNRNYRRYFLKWFLQKFFYRLLEESPRNFSSIFFIRSTCRAPDECFFFFQRCGKVFKSVLRYSYRKWARDNYRNGFRNFCAGILKNKPQDFCSMFSNVFQAVVSKISWIG